MNRKETPKGNIYYVGFDLIDKRYTIQEVSNQRKETFLWLGSDINDRILIDREIANQIKRVLEIYIDQGNLKEKKHEEIK
jgi:hypothetical protein